MIVGIGMDVVEVGRIARLLGAATADRFVARCFTAGEQAYCDAHVDRATRYAARFAAKEAVMKALGAPVGLRWTDIEVERGEGGAPQVRLHGAAEGAARQRRVGAIHLTLSHDGGVAAATVVLERGPP